MNRSLIILGLLILPQVAAAGIEITEIAWMGSATNANDEWIELYNSGSESVSLEGWTIEDGGETPLVTLTGVLSPNTYSLLKSTYGDGDIDDVSPHVLVYSRLLSNSGKTLAVKDAGGSTIDQVVGGTNWESIGGSNETKETPQKTLSGTWITAAPTPGRATEGGGSPSQDNDDNSSRGGGGSSSSAKKVVEEEKLPGVLSLSLAGPETVYVGQDTLFTGVPSGIGPTIARSLKYVWNFGDLETGEGREVTHTYTLPGTYVLVLEAAFGEHLETVEKTITVLPISLVMTRDEQGNISIKNVATHDIRLDGYILKGSKEVVFPKYSIIKSNGTLTLPGSRVEDIPGPVLLRDGGGMVVASLSVPETSSKAAPQPLSSVRSATLSQQVSPTKEVVSETPPATFASQEARSVKEGPATTSTSQGTTQVAALPVTIPLYESGGAPPASSSFVEKVLPYIALFALITGGLLALQRLRGMGREKKESPPMPF